MLDAIRAYEGFTVEFVFSLLGITLLASNFALVIWYGWRYRLLINPFNRSFLHTINIPIQKIFYLKKKIVLCFSL